MANASTCGVVAAAECGLDRGERECCWQIVRLPATLGHLATPQSSFHKLQELSCLLLLSQLQLAVLGQGSFPSLCY